jgi:hypothetical protein
MPQIATAIRLGSSADVRARVLLPSPLVAFCGLRVGMDVWSGTAARPGHLDARRMAERADGTS